MQNAGFCFHIHSLSLCLFIGELRPLILSYINDQWLLAQLSFGSAVVYFHSWGYAGRGKSDICVVVGVVSFLELRISF